MAKVCPQCGSKLPYAAAKFCPECGTRLRDGPGDDPESEIDEHGAERLTSETLAGMSKEELVGIILDQDVAVPRGTRQLFDASKIPFTTSFGVKIDTGVDKYIRLPVESEDQPPDEDAPVWRIKLLSANPEHKLLGIDVCGDVLIGRAASSVTPDLDLTKYGGVNLGVSRRHALLRPTEANLFLIDLGSSNGTYRNGSRVSVGVAQPIRDRDAISFGGVHFMIKFVIKPSDRKTEA